MTEQQLKQMMETEARCRRDAAAQIESITRPLEKKLSDQIALVEADQLDLDSRLTQMEMQITELQARVSLLQAQNA